MVDVYGKNGIFTMKQKTKTIFEVETTRLVDQSRFDGLVTLSLVG